MSETNRDIQQGEKSVYAEKGDVFITYAGERRIPHALTPPPFLPEIFLGRADDLRRIHDKLFAPGGNLLLLVNGEGGVGKTSVASKYFHDYEHEYAHVAWVLSERNIAAALLLLAIPLGLRFDEQAGTDERLEILLQALANLKKPCLLVLDNANELDDLETHYQRLRRCSNFHLLLTTRITDFEQAETCRIEGLPEEEGLALFEKHYRRLPPDERALFAQIRDAVGANTLVLELLAKNLAAQNRLKTNYALADLLRDLQGRGLLQLTRSQEVRTDYQAKGQMRRARPEDIIAAMYDLGGLSPEEVALLSAFAVLPAERVPFAVLENLLGNSAGATSSHPDTVLDARLLALAQKGWLSMESKSPDDSKSGADSESPPDSEVHFKCSPVVQEVVRLKNPQLRADCQPLVDALVEKLDYQPGTGHFLNATYEEALLFARYAEAVVAAFSEPEYKLGVLCERIGRYHITTGNIERGLFFFEKIIQNYEALCVTDPDNSDFKNGLAISYSKLGDAHTALGNLDKALTFFEQYNQLEKELYEAYPQNVSFKNSLAISYEKLGSTQTALGNLDKALTFFEERSRLGEELYEAYPQNVSFKNGLAISYSKLGETHTALGKLDKALRFFQNHNELSEELYASYPQNVSFKNGLAISYNYLANTYTSLGRLNEALSAYEGYHSLSKELFETYPENVKFKNDFAISYEKLGSTHTVLGNLDKALRFFQNGNELFEELYEAYPQNVSFKNGLAIFYSKLGETHTSLGNLDKALTFFEERSRLGKELYEAYPQNVSFKNGLAISYSKLGAFYRDQKGDKKKARGYFEQCRVLLKELSEAHPAYVEFQKNFDWAKNALEGLE